MNKLLPFFAPNFRKWYCAAYSFLLSVFLFVNQNVSALLNSGVIGPYENAANVADLRTGASQRVFCATAMDCLGMRSYVLSLGIFISQKF